MFFRFREPLLQIQGRPSQDSGHAISVSRTSDGAARYSGPPVITLLHVSDLHFGPPFVPSVGEAALRLAERVTPDTVVVSGDLTQRAKPEQFADASKFIERLPDVPRLVVPGNHDVPLYRVWERLTDPHGAYRQEMGDSLEGVLRLPGALLVGLDSTSPRRTITRGRITRKQVDWAVAMLSQAPPGAARIVVAHHHFADAPDTLRDRSMIGGAMAMESFVEAGVDLVLGGHLHRAFIGDSLDFFFQGPRDRGVIIVQSGTTTSRRGRGRERERNTLNVIRVHETWVEITHHLYYQDDDEFSPLSHHVFPRNGHRLGTRAGETFTAPADTAIVRTRPVSSE